MAPKLIQTHSKLSHISLISWVLLYIEGNRIIKGKYLGRLFNLPPRLQLKCLYESIVFFLDISQNIGLVFCYSDDRSRVNLLLPSLLHVARRQHHMKEAWMEGWAVQRQGMHGWLGFYSCISPCITAYISCFGVKRDTIWENTLSFWNWLMWRTIRFEKSATSGGLPEFPPWPSFKSSAAFPISAVKI